MKIRLTEFEMNDGATLRLQFLGASKYRKRTLTAHYRHSGGNRSHRSHNPLYMPPSTKTVWPVTYDARSEASQTMVSATSRGSPSRLSGASAAQPSKISCSDFPDVAERAFANSFNRSVAVNPGPMLLTRI